MAKSGVAGQCEAAARGHDRPFVVEWDATDLASFEAKAARDTIFVHYEGCKIDVLYGCSAPTAPGRLGAYGTPTFTSGTVQGFDVKNEGELYAKLPLGAAELSGRVAAGEMLHLKYFVSGVATDTRDSVYASELSSYQGCATATHFVWAYNLGAFELVADAQTSQEAKADLGGIGTGGKRSSRESSLGNGGDLASCATQDQRACRVPIRLALRAITPGNNPIDAPAAPAPPAPGTALPPAGQGTPASSVVKEILDDAKAKLDAGDGTGCVTDANRAAGMDPRLMDDADFKLIRATCLMRSGMCDEGTADYRAAVAGADIKRELADWQLDRQVRSYANAKCPSGTAHNDADFIARALIEQKAAVRVNDAATCKDLAIKVYAHEKTLRATSPKTSAEEIERSDTYQLASAVLLHAGQCVAQGTRRCSDGFPVFQLQYTVIPRPISGWEKLSRDAWALSIKDIDCQ